MPDPITGYDDESKSIKKGDKVTKDYEELGET
jgi:hypothetical protein